MHGTSYCHVEHYTGDRRLCGWDFGQRVSMGSARRGGRDRVTELLQLSYCTSGKLCFR